MDDLRGSASQRLSQLADIRARGAVPTAWTMQQLLITLRDLDHVGAFAADEQDRREDF
jgi:hypothetical protein